MSGLRFVGYQNQKESRKKLRELYNTAFPKEELIPFWMLKMRSKKGIGEFYGIYDQEEFVGMVYLIHYKDMIYIFYFAIHESMRGRGYGGRTLQTLQKKYKDKRIFLCIEEMNPEAENYAQRLRRKSFYEKNGFELLPFKVKEGRMVYDSMCVAGREPQITGEDCENVMKHYFGIWKPCLYLSQLRTSKNH